MRNEDKNNEATSDNNQHDENVRRMIHDDTKGSGKKKKKLHLAPSHFQEDDGPQHTRPNVNRYEEDVLPRFAARHAQRIENKLMTAANGPSSTHGSSVSQSQNEERSNVQRKRFGKGEEEKTEGLQSGCSNIIVHNDDDSIRPGAFPVPGPNAEQDDGQLSAVTTTTTQTRQHSQQQPPPVAVIADLAPDTDAIQFEINELRRQLQEKDDQLLRQHNLPPLAVIANPAPDTDAIQLEINELRQQLQEKDDLLRRQQQESKYGSIVANLIRKIQKLYVCCGGLSRRYILLIFLLLMIVVIAVVMVSLNFLSTSKTNNNNNNNFEKESSSPPQIIMSGSPTLEPSLGLTNNRCNLTLGIECIPPQYYESCDTLPPVRTLCMQRPYEMVFRYNGGNCDGSFNNHPTTKFICGDHGPRPGPPIKDGELSYIVVVELGGGEEYFYGFVRVGDTFPAFAEDKFAANINITIYNIPPGETNPENIVLTENIVQTMFFHTSCSQNLFIADRFGSIELVEYTNFVQGRVNGFHTISLILTTTAPSKVLLTNLEISSNWGEMFNLSNQITNIELSPIISQDVVIQDDLVLDSTIQQNDIAMIMISGRTDEGFECLGTTFLDFIYRISLQP